MRLYIINFSLPSKNRSLPTKFTVILYPLFHSVQEPLLLCPDTLFLAHPSAFARSRAAPTISGSGSAPVQKEENRCLVTIAVALSPQRTQPMADNYLGGQSRTGGGLFISPGYICNIWTRHELHIFRIFLHIVLYIFCILVFKMYYFAYICIYFAYL